MAFYDGFQWVSEVEKHDVSLETEIEPCSDRGVKHLNSSSQDGDCLKLPLFAELGAAVRMGGHGATQLLLSHNWAIPHVALHEGGEGRRENIAVISEHCSQQHISTEREIPIPISEKVGLPLQVLELYLSSWCLSFVSITGQKKKLHNFNLSVYIVF